ncbi:MAG: hydrogenase iron-sulfur subunit [Chloroflexi bacterium]|jgi:F420-non-reducing hydrogenase iron-sulfur subunit|nr:hydrogenase iron-sulfur subunit [Chloroflexota bacterium]
MSNKFKICKDDFEPRIVGFVCNWGAYSSLEMAGVNKLKYAPDVKLIRLMCLGRVHTGLVLKAFEMGADGILLLGCPPGSCHYEFGVDRTKESVAQMKKMLNLLGLGSKRVHLVEVPPDDGEFVARRINAFVKRTKDLGPSPVKYAPSQIEMVDPSASLF